jgi:hypothetical protein
MSRTLGAAALTDMTRGMAYCLPAVVVGLAVLAEREPLRNIERMAAFSGVISFLVPTFYVEGGTGVWWLYPLPLQIGRWLVLRGR